MLKRQCTRWKKKHACIGALHLVLCIVFGRVCIVFSPVCISFSPVCISFRPVNMRLSDRLNWPILAL